MAQSCYQWPMAGGPPIKSGEKGPIFTEKGPHFRNMKPYGRILRLSMVSLHVVIERIGLEK